MTNKKVLKLEKIFVQNDSWHRVSILRYGEQSLVHFHFLWFCVTVTLVGVNFMSSQRVRVWNYDDDGADGRKHLSVYSVPGTVSSVQHLLFYWIFITI